MDFWFWTSSLTGSCHEMKKFASVNMRIKRRSPIGWLNRLSLTARAMLVAGKLAHERKTSGLALAPPCLHWQIIVRSSKLGRESCSVNPETHEFHYLRHLLFTCQQYLVLWGSLTGWIVFSRHHCFNTLHGTQILLANDLLCWTHGVS